LLVERCDDLFPPAAEEAGAAQHALRARDRHQYLGMRGCVQSELVERMPDVLAVVKVERGEEGTPGCVAYRLGGEFGQDQWAHDRPDAQDNLDGGSGVVDGG
jgi:hypothetical protein